MKWLLAIGLLLAGASPAHVQQQCAPYERAATMLKEKYSEARIWAGIMRMPQGAFEVELWQSEAGTWTMLALRGDMACMMHSGEGGEALIVGDEV